MIISMRPDIKTIISPDTKNCGIVQLLQQSTLVEQPFTYGTPTMTVFVNCIINAIEQ